MSAWTPSNPAELTRSHAGIGWGLVAVAAVLLAAAVLQAQAERRRSSVSGPASPGPGTAVLARELGGATKAATDGDGVRLRPGDGVSLDATLPATGGRVWVEARTPDDRTRPRLRVVEDGENLGARSLDADWSAHAYPILKSGRVELRHGDRAGGDGSEIQIRRAFVEPAGTGWTGAELERWSRRLPTHIWFVAGVAILCCGMALLPPGWSRIVAMLMIVAVSRCLVPGHGPWEVDEFLFSGAVLDYDVLHDSPQAPGCPAWIGMGRLVAWTVGVGPYQALMGLSLLMSIVICVPISIVAARISGSETAGILAGLLYSFFPTAWMDAPRAFNVGPSVCLLVGAVAMLSRKGLASAAVGGALCGLCMGVRPQMAVIATPVLVGLLASRNTRNAGRVVAVASLLAVCLGWLVPMLADTGIEPYWTALRGKGSDTLGHGLRFEDATWTLLEPLWGGSRCGLVIYLLAGVGLCRLGIDRPRQALALGAATLLTAFWVLGFHGPLPRYRVALLVPIAVLAAAGLRGLARNRDGLAFTILAALMAWMGQVPLEALAIATVESPPPAAFLESVREEPARSGFYVYPHNLWAAVRYGRLTDPGFPMARDEGLLDQLPADRATFQVTDLTDQPGPRPDGTERGWEWTEPALRSVAQGRFCRLFVERVPAAFGKGWWDEEVFGGERWRWADVESEVFLAPTPSGGRLTLGLEAPEALVYQRPELSLRIVNPSDSGQEDWLDAFAPGRFENRTYTIGKEHLTAGGWTKLKLVVRGADTSKLTWDGRHRDGAPFHLVLRVFELKWDAREEDESNPSGLDRPSDAKPR